MALQCDICLAMWKSFKFMLPCIAIHDLNKYYHYLFYTIYTPVLKGQKMNKIQMHYNDWIFILNCKTCNERNISIKVLGIWVQLFAIGLYTTN